MRSLSLLACLAACSPLYGGPSEQLHTPAPKLRGAVATDPIPYVEDCEVDFQREPRAVHRERTVAAQLVAVGDTAAQTGSVATAIHSYGDALRADPYDAEATLALALAYDRVLHKGCALAMLRRLESLTANPQLAAAAIRQIDDVVDNRQWFRGYRTDALHAVNH